MTKIKKFLSTLLGLLLIPVVISIFFIDRVILVFLPHVKSSTIGEVFTDLKLLAHSIYRVGQMFFIYCIYLLITKLI